MLKDIKEALKLNPSARQLRAFGVTLALILFFVGYRLEANYLYWLTAVALILAVFTPRFFKPITITLLAATTPIGWTIFRIALIIFFFAVVTPVALARRLLKRDSLKLKPRKTESYWEDIEPNQNYDKMHL